MLKFMKNFFGFGQAEPSAAPYKVEAPAPVVPVVEAKPVEDLADIALAQRPAVPKSAPKKPAAKKPAAKKAPVKKPAAMKAAKKKPAK